MYPQRGQAGPGPAGLPPRRVRGPGGPALVRGESTGGACAGGASAGPTPPRACLRPRGRGAAGQAPPAACGRVGP
jgi:hypothetical protein